MVWWICCQIPNLLWITLSISEMKWHKASKTVLARIVWALMNIWGGAKCDKEPSMSWTLTTIFSSNCLSPHSEGVTIGYEWGHEPSLCFRLTSQAAWRLSWWDQLGEDLQNLENNNFQNLQKSELHNFRRWSPWELLGWCATSASGKESSGLERFWFSLLICRH